MKSTLLRECSASLCGSRGSHRGEPCVRCLLPHACPLDTCRRWSEARKKLLASLSRPSALLWIFPSPISCALSVTRCSRTKTPRNTASLLRLERTKLVRFPVPGPGTSTFRTRQRIVSALAGGRGTVSRWARGRFESRYPVRAAGLVLRGQQSRL